MVFIGQAVGVDERSALAAKLGGPDVHVADEAAEAAAHVFRDDVAGVAGAAHQGAGQQVLQGHLFPGDDVLYAGVGSDVALGGAESRNLVRIVDVPPVHGLRRQQGGHHHRQPGHIERRVRIEGIQHVARGRVHHHGGPGVDHRRRFVGGKAGRHHAQKKDEHQRESQERTDKLFHGKLRNHIRNCIRVSIKI